jgi:hypothetical protein
MLYVSLAPAWGDDYMLLPFAPFDLVEIRGELCVLVKAVKRVFGVQVSSRTPLSGVKV